MKILLVHNRYQASSPTGEDVVFDSERNLLAAGGHEVVTYERFNDDLNKLPAWRRPLVAGLSAVWSPRAFHELRALIGRERPQLVHLHNTFPLISPAACYAAKEAGLPLVWTLHNFRNVCANGLLYREGAFCERCLHEGPLPGLRYGCYHERRTHTLPLVATQLLHRHLHTYERAVDRFIALSPFAKRKFCEGGLPVEKLVMKPNFVKSPEAPSEEIERPAFLFAGRLDALKGVPFLIELLRHWEGAPIVIAGGGPLENEVRALCDANPRIRFVGFRPHDEMLGLMRKARALLFPSRVYENCPLSVLEAFASATPVLACNHGSISDLVHEHREGRLLPADSVGDWRDAMLALADPATARTLGQTARRTYEARYTPEIALAATEALYTTLLTGP